MSKGFYLIGAIVIVCAGLGVYGWLSIRGADTQQFLYVFGTVAAPTLGLLWNNMKTQQIAEQVNTIEAQTNGELKAQFKDLKEHITENNGN